MVGESLNSNFLILFLIFTSKMENKNGQQKDGKQLRIYFLMENKEMENKHGKQTPIPIYK